MSKSLTTTEQTVIDAWMKVVCNQESEIDPNGEWDWPSMFVGFALARGLTPVEATRRVLYEAAWEADHCARVVGQND